MKSILKLVFACQLALSVICFGQKDSNVTVKHKFVITTVNASLGTTLHGGRSRVSVGDFRSLAPNSTMLKNDFTGYTPYFGSGYEQIHGNENLSLFVGLNKIGSNGEIMQNPQIRVGISYTANAYINYGLQKSKLQASDTIKTTTNDVYVYEKYVGDNYQLNYLAERLMLENSIIYRSKKDTRISTFGGLGLSLGVLFNAQTTISNYKDISINEYFNGDFVSKEYSSRVDTSKPQFESFRNKTGITATLYLPMDLDYRLGKTNFLKRYHIIYELRPNISFVNIPELRTFVSLYTSHSIGLKAYLR